MLPVVKGLELNFQLLSRSHPYVASCPLNVFKLLQEANHLYFIILKIRNRYVKGWIWSQLLHRHHSRMKSSFKFIYTM